MEVLYRLAEKIHLTQNAAGKQIGLREKAARCKCCLLASDRYPPHIPLRALKIPEHGLLGRGALVRFCGGVPKSPQGPSPYHPF